MLPFLERFYLQRIESDLAHSRGVDLPDIRARRPKRYPKPPRSLPRLPHITPQDDGRRFGWVRGEDDIWRWEGGKTLRVVGPDVFAKRKTFARVKLMAKPKTTETKDEALQRAFAIVRGPRGGWVCRTYLVPSVSTLHEDSEQDVFSAAVGRIMRELAREGT